MLNGGSCAIIGPSMPRILIFSSKLDEQSYRNVISTSHNHSHSGMCPPVSWLQCNQCWMLSNLLEVGRKRPCSAKLLAVGKLQRHRSLVWRNHSNRSSRTLLSAVKLRFQPFRMRVWVISSCPVEVQKVWRYLFITHHFDWVVILFCLLFAEIPETM